MKQTLLPLAAVSQFLFRNGFYAFLIWKKKAAPTIRCSNHYIVIVRAHVAYMNKQTVACKIHIEYARTTLRLWEHINYYLYFGSCFFF